MKKIIAVLIILLLLTACTSPAQFKPNDPANSESMNNFLAQENAAYAAKIRRSKRIKTQAFCSFTITMQIAQNGFLMSRKNRNH